MDAKRAAELQDDEQRDGTMETAIRAVVEGELVDVHTSLPGIVKSFDAKTQTAVVQPAVRRLFIRKGYMDLPQCVDVPVAFPRWGNFVLTGPVSPGDEGLLKFAERSIDFWWDRGGTQEPSEPRMHDLSDAFFEPAYSSRGRVPANIAGDAVELRTLDGQTVFRLEKDVAIVGTPIGAEPPYKADTHHKLLDAYLDQIITGLKAAMGANGIPTVTLETAQSTWKAAIKAAFATRAKVG